MGITLRGESEMAPRTQLVSVPYALNAGDVRGADIHPDSVHAGNYLYHSFVESPDVKNVYDEAVLLAVGGAWAQASPGHDLSWHVVAGGGRDVASEGHVVRGTLGQFSIGPGKSILFK